METWRFCNDRKFVRRERPGLSQLVILAGGDPGAGCADTHLLLTPAFVQLEYRTPNFPPDSYGFTQQDRLLWSQIALEYLLNDEGINFLEDLVFEDGAQVYNARELKHMLDVKEVVQVTRIMGILGRVDGFL